MPTWEFLCAAGHLTEAFLPRAEASVPCRTCQGPARRQFTLSRGDQIRIHGGFHINRSQVGEPRNKKVWRMAKEGG